MCTELGCLLHIYSAVVMRISNVNNIKYQKYFYVIVVSRVRISPINDGRELLLDIDNLSPFDGVFIAHNYRT